MAIDMIINDQDGLVVAHDDKKLDDFVELNISLEDGATSLQGPNGTLTMPSLKKSMTDMFSSRLIENFKMGKGGWLVRMGSNYRVAKVSSLKVNVT